MPAPTEQISDDRLLSRWAGLPLPLLLLAIALCLLFDPRGVFQPPWLLPILSFVFSGVISIAVAYLAFRSYLAGGSGSVLLLGCGMLIFGLSNMLGSLVSDLHDPNIGVAFFNIAVVIAGICHLGSAVWASTASRPSWRRRTSRLYPVLAYGAILLLLMLLLQAIQAHQLPTFFVQGQGPTPIRQVVLGTAILLFTLAATQFWALARRAERAFFRWYGLGLGLIAVGLVGVYFQKAVGTPLNWVGRSAQYLGGVYILVALLTVLQDCGLPLGKALALFFGEAETEYRPLVEATKDAILSLDADGHILYWNEGASRLFGHTAAEALGAHLMTLVAPPGTEERLQKAWDGLPRTAEGQVIGATLESELAAKGGRAFWAELAFYARPSTRGSLTVCIVRDITERKQAEKTLQRLNAALEARVEERTAELDAERTRWKQVVQGIADEVWVCDLQGRMSLVNLPAVTHLGLEEFKDKSVEQVLEAVEFLNPDGQPRPPEQAPVLRSLRGEVVRGEEIMRHRTTGTTRWRQFSSSPMRDAAGTIIGSVAVERDITDQKQIEEQLRELSQRLTYHVDHSPLAVIEWGPDMRLTRWSGAAERIFGWTAAEVLGKRMEDFRWIHAGDEPQVAEVSADLQTGTNPHRSPANRNYRKDGSVVECEWHNSSLVDGAGKLRSILSLVLDVTERKQAETALRESEERFRSLVEGVTDHAIFMLDPEGRVTSWNAGAERINGYHADEIVGRHFSCFYGPEELAQGTPAQHLREAAKAGQFQAEGWRVRKGGSRFWADVILTALHDDAGNLRGFAKVTRDTTERRRAEEVVRVSQARLAGIVGSAMDAIISVDADQRIVLFNAAAERMFGCPAAEALGQPLDRFLPPRHRDRHREHVRGFETTGKTTRRMDALGVLSALRTDGQEFPIEVSISQVEVTGQKLFTAILRDITERKRAKEALEGVAEFPNENPNPVLRVARDGTLLYANRGSAPLLTLWECQVGQRLPADWCGRMAVAYEAGQVQEVDVTCGSRIFSCLLHPIGERGYLNVYGRDISTRKAAEAALQQLNAELEARVTQRTAELSNAFLKVSLQSEQLRSLASELTLVEQRERSRLAELIHDGLQQLLVSAKLRVTLVERAQDPNARQDCQEIGRLLDEAVADARSLTAELSPPILRTGGLLAGLEWLARWNEEKHHLAVDMQAPATPLPPLPEDLTVLLFQSVRELLFNTVKYARVQKAQVALAATEEGLTLTVADAGAGFDPSSLRGEGGVAGGFGLARIRHRLELLGGCMDINSAPGHGSRITLAVPFRRAEQRPTDPRHPQTRSVSCVDVAPGPESTRRIRVLIVDDHRVLRQALARMLGAEVDIEVVGEAGTGTAAVVLARQLSPDVVLMDINMPEMNGIDATRAIHAAFPAMRVIGLSMFERGDQQSAMQDAGAAAYVSKSGPVEALLAAIRGGR